MKLKVSLAAVLTACAFSPFITQDCHAFDWRLISDGSDELMRGDEEDAFHPYVSGDQVQFSNDQLGSRTFFNYGERSSGVAQIPFTSKEAPLTMEVRREDHAFFSGVGVPKDMFGSSFDSDYSIVMAYNQSNLFNVQGLSLSVAATKGIHADPSDLLASSEVLIYAGSTFRF